ncbi:hypothetical protein [Pedobacter miscanthi]|uniref:hypothetical protein n=1 Tax=Pedobacter miscanthi TaxID=2259170 RepID=UPI0029319247|nr:hypothetical protein [Pedobacter miscanthi]
MKTNSFKIIIFSFAMALILSACQKNEYYVDGGLSGQPESEKSMTAYDFLASRPNHLFDSLIKIINLTNTKALINQQNITIYATPNDAIMRFQRRFTPSDRQAARPLAKIGVDTLKMLLNRFIIPNANVALEEVIPDKIKYYKDNNTDSLLIYGVGGGFSPGSTLQTSAFSMEYEHRKIKLVDSVNYRCKIQTHNLITANARIHVLERASSFSGGLKLKYFRIADVN